MNRPATATTKDLQRVPGGDFPALLHRSQGELAKLIRSGPLVERFMRCALTEFRTRPELAQCSAQSVMAAVMLSAQMNLEIGKGLRQGYLVPYKGECEFQVSYIGFLELARRTGYYKDIDACIVCENDIFTYERAPKPTLYHRPDLWKPGAELGAYVYAVLTNGEAKFLAMNRAEIEQVRKASKNANGGPWVAWWGEMAKKSVVKRFLKTGPLSPELGRAFELEEADLAPVMATATHRPDPAVSRAADLATRLRGGPAAPEAPAIEGPTGDDIPFISPAPDDTYATEGGEAN
jgi:recombination protein RecT